jgi:hypothetical protein
MNVGDVAKRTVGGMLAAALPMLLLSPADARRDKPLPSYNPPQPAYVGPSDLGRYPDGPARSRPRFSAGIPLPPRRPPEFVAPAPERPQAPATAETDRPAPLGDDAETCAAVLASGNVIAEATAPIRSGLCNIEHPLTLKAVVLADKRQIKLEPPVAMRCRLAGTLAQWIIEDVAPAIAEAGKPLEALSGVGGYECRGRNGVAGAKLSEHAIGNAFDLGGLKLADGRIISVQEQHEVPLFEKIRASACARFSTVLGPGADASHKTHVHLDLQERRHDYKMCQWDVASPPPAVAEQPPPSPDKRPDNAEKKNEDRRLSHGRASARRR